jgi:hypothetical protein
MSLNAFNCFQIQRRDRQVKNTKKQSEEFATSIWTVQANLEDERKRHQEHVRGLRIARQTYQLEQSHRTDRDEPGKKKGPVKRRGGASQFMHHPDSERGKPDKEEGSVHLVTRGQLMMRLPSFQVLVFAARCDICSSWMPQSRSRFSFHRLSILSATVTVQSPIDIWK